MTRVISIEDLKGLFTKPYGTDAPTKQKWAEFYNENVIFVDPTQETEGLDSYIKAQEKLVKRCDDVYLNIWILFKSYVHLQSIISRFLISKSAFNNCIF